MIIKLSQGFIATIDDQDYDLVSGHTWWICADGYAFTTVARKTVFMHRKIMSAQKGQMIDHINRDRVDNRRANLRFCNRSGNSANLSRENQSGFKGVRIIKFPPHRPYCYRAEVYKGGQIYLGSRRREAVEAAQDYDALARKIHGEFAFQNFPETCSLSLNVNKKHRVRA